MVQLVNFPHVLKQQNYHRTSSCQILSTIVTLLFFYNAVLVFHQMQWDTFQRVSLASPQNFPKLLEIIKMFSEDILYKQAFVGFISASCGFIHGNVALFLLLLNLECER